MILQSWGTLLSQSFVNLWAGVAAFVPNLVVAIVIFVIGWFVGVFIGHLVEQVFKSIKVDTALKSAGVGDVLERGGLRLDSGAFVGGLVKWFVILAFLVAAFDALHLDKATAFLTSIAQFVPQVIVAVLILMVAVVVAEFVHKVVVASAKAAGIRQAGFVGNVAKWAIWIFGLIFALSQVGIAYDFLLTLFQGIIIALSVAVGLSFGLGGQEAAGRYIEKMRGEFSHDK